MANPNKRRRLGNSDPPEDSDSERLIKTFDKVEPLLCDLLAASRSIIDLDAVVGEQRAGFINMLRSRIWVDRETPSGSSMERTVTKKSATSLGKRPAPPVYAPEFVPPLSEERYIPVVNRSSNGSSWPPQLPHIENASIRQDALMPGEAAHNFQRMEFLGDAYLQMISTHILYDRFPSSREGPLSDMRSKLVANIPLCEYARLYNFSSLMPGSPSWKNLADSFEAYVGGIVLSDPGRGIQTLQKWLAALYEPKMQEMARNLKVQKVKFPVKTGIKKPRFKRPPVGQRSREKSIARGALHPLPIRDLIPPEEDEWEEWGDVMMVDEPGAQHYGVSPVDKGARDALESLISGDGVAVSYVSFDGARDGIEVMAVLTGWGFIDQPIGQGWGLNEEEACLRAARSAILNRDFCDQIHDAKSLYQEPIHGKSPHQEPIQLIPEPTHQESIHQEPIQLIQEPILRESTRQGSIYRETVQPIALASQEVQEATAPAPSESQSHKQLAVQTAPWKDVEGVIVIDDD